MKNYKLSLSVIFTLGFLFLGFVFQVNAQNNLTGTYRLDTSRSDNVQEIVDEAINRNNIPNREEARQDLRERLESPPDLAIEMRGNEAIIASSITSQISFSADGQDHTQTMSDGSTMRVRTSLRGQQLTISSLINGNDYTVIFNSINNGTVLKVTRRMTTDYLSETVFTESIYTKTDSVARLDISQDIDMPSDSVIGGNDPNDNDPIDTNPSQTQRNPNPPRTTGNNPPMTRTSQRIGQYTVPSGEIVTGVLENLVSTKISQNNDRFRLRVTGPNQYRGATIEGYISGIDRSGRNPVGSAKITFNFEKITLANGQSYDFAGFLQSVTDINGKNIKVDQEGTISKSQTKSTAKRAGIGAGAGAILGAILGGGKGAIIGATIGAGGGAGSVALENQGDLELEAGTALTIQSSSPTT